MLANHYTAAFALWILFSSVFNNVFILHSVKLLWIMNWKGYVRSDGGAFEGIIQEYVQRG
jgi:hypothetical protein